MAVCLGKLDVKAVLRMCYAGDDMLVTLEDSDTVEKTLTVWDITTICNTWH
jgi:hypothetical protein